MILRTGVDLIEIEQFEKAYHRHGDRLLFRVFTQQEINATDHNIQSLAARFAAKEAVSKALGTGIGDVSWHEIEILRGQAREPVIILHGNANRLSQEAGIENWAISLSHTRALAIAFVVATGSSCK